MRALLFMLPILVTSGATQAADARPVILQSKCTPNANSGQTGSFGFELIQTAGNWSARVYPAKGSRYPAETIEFPQANVRFVKSPKSGNDTVFLSQSLEKSRNRVTVLALSEIVPGKPTPTPFSVTLAIGPIGGDGVDHRLYVHASCSFVNDATPYERKPL